MKSVTLVENQAKLVLQSIDIAIKAGGTQSAAILLPLVYEIEKQLTTSSEEQTDK